MPTPVSFNSAGTSLFDFCSQGTLSYCFMSCFMLFSDIFGKWECSNREIYSQYAQINLCEILFSYEYQQINIIEIRIHCYVFQGLSNQIFTHKGRCKIWSFCPEQDLTFHKNILHFFHTFHNPPRSRTLTRAWVSSFSTLHACKIKNFLEKRNFVYSLWIQKPARYCKVFSSFSGKLQSFGRSSKCLQPERWTKITFAYQTSRCLLVLSTNFGGSKLFRKRA